jgi:hypothetical protein
MRASTEEKATQTKPNQTNSVECSAGLTLGIKATQDQSVNINIGINRGVTRSSRKITQQGFVDSDTHGYGAGISGVQSHDGSGDTSQGHGVGYSNDVARDVRTSKIKNNNKHSGTHIQARSNYSEELSEQQHARGRFEVAQEHPVQNKKKNSYNINDIGGPKCQDQVLNIDVVMMPVDC